VAPASGWFPQEIAGFLFFVDKLKKNPLVPGCKWFFNFFGLFATCALFRQRGTAKAVPIPGEAIFIITS